MTQMGIPPMIVLLAGPIEVVRSIHNNCHHSLSAVVPFVDNYLSPLHFLHSSNAMYKGRKTTLQMESSAGFSVCLAKRSLLRQCNCKILSLTVCFNWEGLLPGMLLGKAWSIGELWELAKGENKLGQGPCQVDESLVSYLMAVVQRHFVNVADQGGTSRCRCTQSSCH